MSFQACDDKKNATIKSNDDVVVRQHIQWFATPEGYITEESMQTGHDLLNITSGVSVKIKAILNLLSSRFPDKVCEGKPFTIDDLLTVVNEARLGIWTDKGKFDEGRMHQIFKMFHPVTRSADGKQVDGAERADFQPELDRIAEKIPKDRRQGTTVFGFIGVTWKAVTSGSVDELVKYWSDSYTVDPQNNKFAAISTDRMRAFYQDGGVTLFKERAEKVKAARETKGSLALSTAEQIQEKEASSPCAIM